MPLPVSQLWEDSVGYARREGHLLVPLVLATLAIGQALMELASVAAEEKMSVPFFAGLGLAGILLAIVGQLAIQALVLRPGSSVRESLEIAVARLPKFVAFTLLLLVFVLVLVTPLAVGLAAIGYDPQSKAETLPGFAVLYLMGVVTFLAWISIRLYLLMPLVVDRNPPLFDAIRHSFAMTRGHALVIMGISLVFLLVGVIAQAAAQAVVGTIFGLIGKMAGLAFLDIVMVSLAVGMVGALIGLLTSIFAALAYRYLAGAR